MAGVPPPATQPTTQSRLDTLEAQYKQQAKMLDDLLDLNKTQAKQLEKHNQVLFRVYPLL